MFTPHSDGKPDDLDGDRHEYATQDTRQALIESEQQSNHLFCIAVDEPASDDLPHMYGAVNDTVIDNVARLPSKVRYLPPLDHLSEGPHMPDYSYMTLLPYPGIADSDI